MLFFGNKTSLTLLGVVGLLAACSKDPTQLIVVVDSDLEAPAEVGQITAQLLARDGREAGEKERMDVTSESFPISFGIAPALDDPNLEITLAIEAFGPNGMLFTTIASTHFIAGKTLLLPIQMLASCLDVLPCASPNHTCRGGRCASSDYDPALLTETTAGRELEDSERPSTRRDGGVSVAADAGIAADASVADAGGMANGPTCVNTTDCDLAGKCAPDAQDCVCRATPMGMNCVPTCSAANTTCPATPTNLQCDTGMNICTPR